MVRVVSNGALEERHTEAAKNYVWTVRSRLEMEVARHGRDALQSRSGQELQRSITPEELVRMWPYADVNEALEA
jgi:hypothetical protein